MSDEKNPGMVKIVKGAWLVANASSLAMVPYLALVSKNFAGAASLYSTGVLAGFVLRLCTEVQVQSENKILQSLPAYNGQRLAEVGYSLLGFGVLPAQDRVTPLGKVLESGELYCKVDASEGLGRPRSKSC